jgi:hypothetical protein
MYPVCLYLQELREVVVQADVDVREFLPVGREDDDLLAANFLDCVRQSPRAPEHF